MGGDTLSKLQPLVFVAMPFGVRKDVSLGVEIDFDRIYETAIKPAAESLGLEVIRGDEERAGGIIMRPVFERLLLAEIVIADLTMQNPNVFYELGVRHSARPRSTILMYAQNTRLPFDVAMVRAIPYQLDDGILSDKAAAELTDELSKKLEYAVRESEYVDSPLSQLIPAFPYIQLPHNVTDSFRDRVVHINTIKTEIFHACSGRDKDAATVILKNIEDEIGALNDANTELFVDLIIAYRDVSAWNDMVRICDMIPHKLTQGIPTIIEQRSFALNRRNNTGDREEALRNLNLLIDEYGDNPETCGLIGRIYKDQFLQAANLDLTNDDLSPALLSLRQESPRARAFLREAIDWYRRGFVSDPRDFYPGINEATLRYVRGDTEDVQFLNDLLPTLAFSLARIGGLDSKSYWVVATVLELNVLMERWESADRTVEKMIALTPFPWMVGTTIQNIHLIKEVQRTREENTSRIQALLIQLQDI